MGRRAPRLVLWGGRPDDVQLGSPEDRAAQALPRLLCVVVATSERATASISAIQAAFAEVERSTRTTRYEARMARARRYVLRRRA